MAIESTLNQQTPRVLSIFRIVVGLLFLAHGTSKFLGVPPWTFGPIPAFGLTWFQGVIEVVGGGLMVLGLFTRPVAFILCGDMAFAYFMAHFPKGFFPSANGGLPAVLYCFSFLLLTFAGGGAWSLDRSVRKSEV